MCSINSLKILLGWTLSVAGAPNKQLLKCLFPQSIPYRYSLGYSLGVFKSSVTKGFCCLVLLLPPPQQLHEHMDLWWVITVLPAAQPSSLLADKCRLQLPGWVRWPSVLLSLCPCLVSDWTGIVCAVCSVSSHLPCQYFLLTVSSSLGAKNCLKTLFSPASLLVSGSCVEEQDIPPEKSFSPLGQKYNKINLTLAHSTVLLKVLCWESKIWAYVEIVCPNSF